MKKIKIVSLIIISLVVIAAVVGLYFRGKLLNSALPDYNSAIKCIELNAKVEVYRDSFAIPHIVAQNEEDLYFVTGYLTAQDRLWQMDVLRRVTYGRLAEIFGEKMVKTDLLMRMLKIPYKSREILAQSDSALLLALDSYAKGVNYFINQNSDKLPPEFKILNYKPEPWKPEHSLNLIGYIAWDLNGSWNSEILLQQIANKLIKEQLDEFIPKMNFQQEVIFSAIHNDPAWRNEMLLTSNNLGNLGLQVFHGSNNWVVSGARTSSGKPMLANDMHLSFRAPGIWYQIHQVVKNGLDVTGVLLPGQPFVVSGHNARIAWGLTNVMNDDIDFYRETTDPNDSMVYKFDGKWVPFKFQNELINIKGKEPLEAVIKFTHRGPVISGLKNLQNEVVSMRWVGNEPSNEVRSIFLINRASNWDEFTDAMKTFISVSQNVAYADIDGNIGLYCCAGIPVRKAGNPMDVLPGDTSLYDWCGMVPFKDLPHTYNPSEGYAISANNRTVSDTYPNYISYWFDLPYRYNRIREMILKDSSMSVEDFRVIQTDQISNFAHIYLPDLIKTISTISDIKPDEKEILESLKKWDGAYSKTDYCATIFEGFYNNFIRNLVLDELGSELYSLVLGDKIVFRNVFHNTWIKNGNILCDNIETKQTETFTDLVIATFRATISEFTQQLGTNYKEWKWGMRHSFVYNHPLGEVKILDKVLNLNRGPYPVGGSFHTVAPFTYRYDKLFEIRSGASQRHIYDLANWDSSLSVIPGGNSGIPSSEHYNDQLTLYLEGKYHRDLFKYDIFKKEKKYLQVFEP